MIHRVSGQQRTLDSPRKSRREQTHDAEFLPQNFIDEAHDGSADISKAFFQEHGSAKGVMGCGEAFWVKRFDLGRGSGDAFQRGPQQSLVHTQLILPVLDTTPLQVSSPSCRNTQH